MSEIIKKMAHTILIHGEDAPGTAQQTALLIVNFAWNLAIGFSVDDDRILKREIAKSKREMPTLWDEFVNSDIDVLIYKLVRYKLKKYPNDERLIAGVQLAPDAKYKEGGHIRVAYIPKASRDMFLALPEAEQHAMLANMLDSE